MIEKTLVLLKPDAVQRSLAGEIISRFERAGLKIIGMKLVHIDKEFARKHYTEDVAKRRGEQVRNWLIEYITEGPVVALVLEGVDAIDHVRKLTGVTEPKSAAPGTIRGDYAHMSYGHADEKKIPIKNLVHASGNKEDAEFEVPLWFSESELFDYKTVHQHLTQ
ncbi:MAG: nucleoside-diphosphate kinase [Candidatus Diapherotrites archaeon]|nr:nucleoside-diphosphate kinase [Candidatus Diapherotrites archaeon]